MKALHSHGRVFLLSCLLLILLSVRSNGQVTNYQYLGWPGQSLLPPDQFTDINNWVINPQTGNLLTLIPEDSAIHMHWEIAGGQGRWVQIYHVFSPPVSIDNFDVFASDIKGSSCLDAASCHRNMTVEFKFENGAKQAVFVRTGEEGLLGIDRWVNKLFFLRNSQNFYVTDGFKWDSINVFSIVLRSYPDNVTIEPDTGDIWFRNFVMDDTHSWVRATDYESLTISPDTLDNIKNKAIAFILGRQTSTGLLTTWAEDNSSWLYGQGLALKALTIEGSWQNNVPMNDYAIAAQKLAAFLAAHQNPDGTWPRAWNSQTGEVIFPYEADGTIWMGDFPFPLMGLSAYLKKTCDQAASAAVIKARNLLISLVDSEGKLSTVNEATGGRIAVTSTEAFVAAIAALRETGDTTTADKLTAYIDNTHWNTGFNYWNEGTYSDRVVLFSNTWTPAVYSLYNNDPQKPLEALSFISRLLYTRGPGAPYGFDGTGPIATWFEGTLSYINAGGPGSNMLMRNLIPYIDPDGSVPHYNDNIGGAAGVWAVPWESLDGTSWLYFTASKLSPLKPLDTGFYCLQTSSDKHNIAEDFVRIYPNPADKVLNIEFLNPATPCCELMIYNMEGILVIDKQIYTSADPVNLDISSLRKGIYLVKIKTGNGEISKKVILME